MSPFTAGAVAVILGQLSLGAFVVIAVASRRGIRRARRAHRQLGALRSAARAHRVEKLLSAELDAAYERIDAELDARAQAGLERAVGSLALSGRSLRSEHGDETLLVAMNNGATLTLGAMAVSTRQHLMRMLCSGPVVLTGATRHALAFKLEFTHPCGARFALWSRTVRVIDEGPPAPA